uniref:Uncharacterized protein n=1 Tax=mine drainage metagenome TaxID=410659 RepID=E6QJX9_9ZZZZ
MPKARGAMRQHIFCATIPLQYQGPVRHVHIRLEVYESIESVSSLAGFLVSWRANHHTQSS